MSLSTNSYTVANRATSFSWLRKISKKVCRENSDDKNDYSSNMKPKSLVEKQNSMEKVIENSNCCGKMFHHSLTKTCENIQNNKCNTETSKENSMSDSENIECCCTQIKKKLRKKRKKDAQNLKSNIPEDPDDTPLHLQGDFLEAMLFPHLDPDKKTSIYGMNQRRGFGMRLLQRGQTTSADLIKELFCPAHTLVNQKLFGGKTGVDIERERSRNSGYVIHPCSNLRQYWDLIVMVMLILNMFILPLDIAFFTHRNPQTWLWFHMVSDFLCIIDIVLNFRTGYRDNAETSVFELNSKKIAIHYVKTWFFLDFLSSLPLNFIMMAAFGETEALSLGLKGASRALKFLKVMKLLNLLKLLRLSRIMRGISQYEEVYCLTASLVRYIKLVCMMLMVAHWNGCLHFVVPMLQDFPSDCWVKLCRLQNEPWYIQYGWALFKTLSHMLCIGYGRFIPMLLSEAIITIFSMVTGATFYALFIAHSMAYIIQNDSSKTTYQEKYQQIQEYMNYRQLPDKIKKRVANYYEHKYHQGRFFDEDRVLSEVSVPLRDEIVNHTCRDLIKTVPFLRDASPNFATAMINKLKFDVFLSGDIIVKEGTVGEEMFFLRKGTVEVTSDEVKLSHLTDGGYFGEICLLTHSRRTASVVALSTCDVFKLTKQDLDSLLLEYPDMKPVIEHAAIARIVNTCRKCKFTTDSDEDDFLHENDLIMATRRTSINKFTHNALLSLLNQNVDKQESDKDYDLSELMQIVVVKHKHIHKDCKLVTPIKEETKF